LSFGASLTASVTGSFDLVVFGSQPVVPASTYNDTVTVTLRNTANNNTLDTSPFTVTVITTNSCQLYTPPGNINLAYTSFQASAATANTSFGVRCTTALPYTMALDATSGTIVGLTYTLALSQTSATGNGVTQNYSVNGSIASGQGGTCSTASCSGSQTRTLTVTY
jgi:spore coat protein U-like protein